MSTEKPDNGETRPVLIRQQHGGALLAGGLVGNAGGPGAPPSALRARLRGSFAERVHVLEKIADDESAAARDRIRAVTALASFGLGAATEVNVDRVRERLAWTVDLVKARLPEQQAAELLMEMRRIWIA